MRKCFLRDKVQCLILKGETYAVQFKELLKLLNKRILRFRQDADKGILIE